MFVLKNKENSVNTDPLMVILCICSHLSGQVGRQKRRFWRTLLGPESCEGRRKRYAQVV
jgi:hypothetical protein